MKKDIFRTSHDFNADCLNLVNVIEACLGYETYEGFIPDKKRNDLIEAMAKVQVGLQDLQRAYYIDDEELYARIQKEKRKQ